MDEIKKIEEQFFKELKKVDDSKTLEELRVDFLGRKNGRINNLMSILKSLPGKEKKEFGLS